MNETLIRTTLLFSVAGLGCVPDFGTGSRDLSVVGVASSTVAACEFDEELPPLLGDAVVLDLAASDTLRLPIMVRNDGDDPISVKEMDLRWECDAQGFTEYQPLRVPAFSATQSFCVDTRTEAADFVGFDVIGMTGAPVLPGEIGVAWAEVVTGALGAGIREAIDLGILARGCLADAQSVIDMSHPDCRAFEQAFAEHTNEPVTDLTLQLFASFAAMDGTQGLSEDSMPPPLSSGLRMQLRGVVRAETSGHDPVFSNEIIHIVEFCRNCGALTGGTPLSREPREGFECYYDRTTPR